MGAEWLAQCQVVYKHNRDFFAFFEQTVPYARRLAEKTNAFGFYESALVAGAVASAKTRIEVLQMGPFLLPSR